MPKQELQKIFDEVYRRRKAMLDACDACWMLTNPKWFYWLHAYYIQQSAVLGKVQAVLIAKMWPEHVELR